MTAVIVRFTVQCWPLLVAAGITALAVLAVLELKPGHRERGRQ